MSTLPPSAAIRAPARVARASAEEPIAEESLWAHARRSLRSRVRAAVTAVLDAGIALLQRLRKRAGGAQDADAEAGEDQPRSRMDRPGTRRDAEAPLAEAEAAAPKPKRRLRAFLVYLSVLLAGGMAGGALAYNLLAELLNRQTAENRRLEASVSKHAKSAATAQKKLEYAEKKLEASLAEGAKSAAENQRKLDEAEKRLGQLPTGKALSDAQQPSPGSAGRKARLFKTSDCTLGSGNIRALKDCIEYFNR